MHGEETELRVRIRGLALMAVGKPKVGFVFRMETNRYTNISII